MFFRQKAYSIADQVVLLLLAKDGLVARDGWFCFLVDHSVVGEKSSSFAEYILAVDGPVPV